MKENKKTAFTEKLKKCTTICTTTFDRLLIFKEKFTTNQLYILFVSADDVGVRVKKLDDEDKKIRNERTAHGLIYTAEKSFTKF